MPPGRPFFRGRSPPPMITTGRVFIRIVTVTCVHQFLNITGLKLVAAEARPFRETRHDRQSLSTDPRVFVRHGDNDLFPLFQHYPFKNRFFSVDSQVLLLKFRMYLIFYNFPRNIKFLRKEVSLTLLHQNCKMSNSWIIPSLGSGMLPLCATLSIK